MISSLELARLARVSQGTVDRALHGRTGVAETTRARILALAAQHGYQANPVAREMMGLAASPLVGAVVHTICSQAVFFSVLMTAVHRRLRADGLHLVMSYGADPAEQREVAVHLLARRMRALLLVHAVPGPLPMAEGTATASLVLPAEGAIALIPDEEATGRGAAQGLLARGHRRLAVISRGEHQVAIARRDSFIAACRQAGAAVQVVGTVADAIAAVTRGVSAVFCNNDPLAEELLTAASMAGMTCPRDLSVVGVDASTTDTRITSMAYPYAAVAEAVAALVAGRPLPAIPDCIWRDGASVGSA
jgi:DNA-binding LacI/PurR family transcriptional regulator